MGKWPPDSGDTVDAPRFVSSRLTAAGESPAQPCRPGVSPRPARRVPQRFSAGALDRQARPATPVPRPGPVRASAVVLAMAAARPRLIYATPRRLALRRPWKRHWSG